MIDAKLLNLTSSPSMDSSIITQDNANSGTDALAGLLLLGQNDQDSANENLLDPNAFAMLLTQVLSNVAPSIEGKVSLDTKEEATEEVLTDPELAQITPQNIATAWIDSQSFQAPSQQIPDETVVLQAGVKAQIDANKTLLPMDLIQKNETNTPSEEELLAALQTKVGVNVNSDGKAAPQEKSAAEVFTTALTSDAAKGTGETKFREDVKNMTDLALGVTVKGKSTIQVPVDTAQIQNTAAQQPQIPIAASQHPKSLEVPVNLNDSQWATKFSEQIVWMTHQNIKSASIRIHPEELGPLEINVKVVNDMATVNITSHSGMVRDIVDQSIPRLRDMMADQGLNLAEVHVGEDSNARQFSQRERGEQDPAATYEEEVEITSLNKKAPKGLIDYEV